MKNICTLLITLMLQNICEAQIKYAKTEQVNISGNCDMCKQSIEKAAKKKKISSAIWDQKAKTAVIAYDSTKTNLNEILKRIALAGYDNPLFIAPDQAYSRLPGCCKYERVGVRFELIKPGNMTIPIQKFIEKQIGMQAVYTAYFELKDALVKSDPTGAANKANGMVAAIQKTEVPSVDAVIKSNWAIMLKSTLKISQSLDLKIQRAEFIELSSIIYNFLKLVKADGVIYHDFCPMANENKGAFWLSKESVIRNPYFGNIMLNCGSVKEVIQP